MNCLVLLSGCGVKDGSCPEEVALTYTALEKYGCAYQPVADDIPVPTVDHLTGQPDQERQILKESARLGRGMLRKIRDVCWEDYDALVIPGGLGLLTNYQHSQAVADCVRYFAAASKPIAAMCAGIDFLRGLLGGDLLLEEVPPLKATEYCCDRQKKIFYTPAFKKTDSCYEIMQGIDAMIADFAKTSA